MKFIELTTTDFQQFTDKSPYKSFTQTPEIATLRERNGWVPYYLGVKEKDQIVAATLLVAKPTFLGKSTFLAPGGPLIDFENTKLTDFFFRHLRQFVRSHNGYILHIDPCYELIERDRDGNPVQGGFNHTKALKNLLALGFKPAPGTGQPKYSFALYINNRTPEQIFADLKRNTRNHIRKAEKAGVKIRELDREELPIFKQITESTSARRGFTDRPLSYYEQMYDLFHAKGEVKFLVAEAEIAGRITPLSAAMFIPYGSEIIYLFSGSDEKYMKEYNAQYLIQWHMIKYSAEHGYKRYNFYGISGLPQNGKLDGIYNFKKGFTSGAEGHVIELIGPHELSANTIFYHLHHLLSKIKHI